jgi:beta-glucanase (GH16 family)
MLLDDRPSKDSAPSGETRSPKHVIPIVSGILAIVLAACVCVVAKNHFDHNGTTTNSASSVPAKAAAKVAPGKPFTPPKSWSLKFNSTFEGNQLNSQLWATCYPWASGGCSNFGNTSDPDQEWYQASQAQVTGGDLHLVAQREPTAGLNAQGDPKTYACRSGMATTYPSLQFEYGYIQITAKIPFGKGLWPALWLAAANQKWPPEVDILEHWDSESSGKVYLHPLTGARQGGSVTTPNLSAGWHTFGLYWTKTRLVWYYDGAQVFATSTGIPQQDMYLIANLAVDNASPGGCSGSLLIKSVKLWQPPV